MPAEENAISLVYYGGDADLNRLDLYDASNSYYGLARTLAVIGHFYVTGEIIVKAPQSAIKLYLQPPSEGSFRQTIIATVVGGVVAVPFTTVATRLMDNWVPADNPELVRIAKAAERQALATERLVALTEEQNRLLKKERKAIVLDATVDQEMERRADEFIKDNNQKLNVIRSITSTSFKNIFRPIGRSAERMGIVEGRREIPKRLIDAEMVAHIEADAVDEKDKIVVAVVSSFSRSSKTGIVYSRDVNLSFRIEYVRKGRLAREDDFSWSQYTGNPIRMTGRFVRYFDGNVKKFLAYHVERLTDAREIREYLESNA